MDSYYSKNEDPSEQMTSEECKFLKTMHSLDRKYPKPFDLGYYHYLYGKLISKTCYDGLKDILEFSNKMHFDIEGLFKREKNINCFVPHACLDCNPRHFLLLTDYGAINRHNSILCGSYLGLAGFAIAKIDRRMFRELWRRSDLERNKPYIPFKMRSYQLFSIYLTYKYRNSPYSSEYGVVLRVLWCSIPDPLLTVTEYSISLFWLSNNPNMKLLANQAWHWYVRCVLGTFETQEKRPRSLKHLSKCAIRLCLKNSFQLPHGVEKLDIPDMLKRYLLLKDLEVK